MTPRAADCTVVVLAKAPEPGLAKTRLIPALGAAGAAALQARLTRHALRTALAAAVGPVELCCTPAAGHPFFRACARDFAITLSQQIGADLGARMAHACARLLLRGPVILIGSDCPALVPADLREAAQALGADCDAVIAPAEDGGYVLIGIGRPQPDLFHGIAWGTASVLAEQRARLAARGLRWRELRTLWDVDRPADLARLTEPGLVDRDGFGDSAHVPAAAR